MECTLTYQLLFFLGFDHRLHRFVANTSLVSSRAIRTHRACHVVGRLHGGAARLAVHADARRAGCARVVPSVQLKGSSAVVGDGRSEDGRGGPVVGER